MKNKFNPKIFNGKPRLEKSILGSQNISKIWIWNPQKNEYEAGNNCYIARRKRNANGLKVVQKKAFASLQDARAWQNCSLPDDKEDITLEKADSPLFAKVVDDYTKNRMNLHKVSTQNLYNRFLSGVNFKYFKDFRIQEISPQVIDSWISYLKSLPTRESRLSFKMDLSLLKSILNYYAERDDSYILPFKKRHKKDIVLKPALGVKTKDITEEQFLKFRAQLLLGKLGLTMYTLATVQFCHALRISEAAAIFMEDVFFNVDPRKSRLKITKSVRYDSNKKGVIQYSFKNATSNMGSKESPLLPNSYYALKKFFEKYPDRMGPLFIQENGELLTYRQIQHAYQKAFKDMTKRTSTSISPWSVVPSDSKWFSRVHVLSDIAVRALRLF